MSLRLELRKTRSKGRYKTRAGTYYIVGTDHTGERVNLSLKTGDRVLAKRLFAEQVAATTRARIEGPMGVANFADAYELYKARQGENSNTLYLDEMLPLIGTKRLCELTQADLDALAETMRPTGSAATRKRHVYTPFCAAYNACVENEPPIAVPRRWRSPRVPKRTVDAPDDAYIAELIQSVRHHERRGKRSQVVTGSRNEARDIAAVLLITLTGCRTGEAAALQLRDVHLDAGRVLFRSTKGKDDNPRQVAMPAMLVEAMRAHIGQLNLGHREEHGSDAPGETLLFAFATRWGLPQMIGRVRRRAGLKHYRPHAIGRHAFATRLLHDGASLADVQKAGGWKKAQMVTDYYGHLSQEHVDKVVSEVDTTALHATPKKVAGKP
jgi:integrase